MITPGLMNRRTTRPVVLLVGEGATALSALGSLIECCEVRCVFRTEDSDGGAVHDLARGRNIPVRALVDNRQLRLGIHEYHPQAVVISSLNRILPVEILSLCKFINVHYSFLPMYRGRANVNWSIINDEKIVGISIHLLHEALDAGNILFQEAIDISPTDTAASLYARLNVIQRRVLGAVVTQAVNGDCGTRQDESLATYGCTRVPHDGEIDWSLSAMSIERLVRALSCPFLEGAFTYLAQRRLTLTRVEVRGNAPKYSGRITGRVAGRSSREGWVDVLTGDGILRIHEVVAEGSSRAEPASSVIRSTRDTLGLSCAELLRCVRTIEKRLATLERWASAMNEVPD
jgi:methionyl-tRNA formyltransferase